jgi:hypothetical protein
MKTFASLLLLVAVSAAQDAGVLIGELKTKQHGVRGKVFAVDEKTFLVKNFQYDGAGPDAFFWVGTSEAPGNEGYILAHPFKGKFYKYDDENAPILTGRFDGTEDIKLTLPEDLNVTDLKWFSVWCRQFSVNFGDLIFPENFSLNKMTIPTVSTTTTFNLPPPLVPVNDFDNEDAFDDSDFKAEPVYEPDDDHYNDEHERFQPRRNGASNLDQDAQPALEATNGHDDHHNDEHERFQPRRNGASNVFSLSHTVVVSAVFYKLL